MGSREDIDRLIDAVRSLEDRVRELEGQGGGDVVVQGFEADEPDEEFDEDGSEYKANSVSDRRVPRAQPESGNVIESWYTLEAVRGAIASGGRVSDGGQFLWESTQG